MKIFFIGLLLFIIGYLLNMFYITVLYHRGLTHRAVILGPKMMKWLSVTGVWVTGLDPKAWATMHRLHHDFADTESDPHSPVHQGVMGVWIGQYKSYLRVIKKLQAKTDLNFLKKVSDIPFDVSFITRNHLTNLPYVTHIIVGLLIWYFTGHLFIGLGYFLGIMSHPVQGWMVNALAHKYGKRNFDTSDHSTNNFFVAMLVFGEGYQNNHHAYPMRAKFSIKPWEFDFGYTMCLIGEKLGLFQIAR